MERVREQSCSVWKFIALLQQKVEHLTEVIRVLQEEVRAQGQVFVDLQRVCTDIENSEE